MRRVLVGGLLAASLVGCGSGPDASPSPSVPAVATSTPPAPTTSPTPTEPGLPPFAPDEPLILYALRTDLGGGIFVMAPDGTERRQLATDILPGVHKGPDWSPDGQSVVFVDEAVNELWIAHLDGSPTERVPGCDGAVCDNPAWSPDGGRIAYERIEGRPGVEGPSAIGIEVVDLATGAVTPVVRLERPVLSDSPRWSGDGTRIVFQVDRMDDAAWETGATIGVVDATGGEPHYLTGFERFASSPDWSWATDEIVFSVELLGLRPEAELDDATWDLFGIQPDGSGERRITTLPEGDRLLAPRWTPDGTFLTAKQFQIATITGGGRRVDPISGLVEPFLTGLEEARPLIRPIPDQP